MYSSLYKPVVVSGFVALSLLAACSSPKADDQAAAPPETPAAAAASAPPVTDTAAASAKLRGTDSTNLSPKFLRGLRELPGSAAYRVRGKWLVLDEQDSVQFPTALPAGRPVTYSGRQGGQTVTLTVTRLTYTSLRFAVELVGGSGGEQQAQGVADLNPGFYLAAEVPEDSDTRTAFGATEFVGETANGNFSLQIGQGKDADKATLFAYDATGKPLPKWQSLPTLRRLAL